MCRSGAVTVAEIGAAGVAAILFPLPWFVADEQAGAAQATAASRHSSMPRRARRGLARFGPMRER